MTHRAPPHRFRVPLLCGAVALFTPTGAAWGQNGGGPGDPLVVRQASSPIAIDGALTEAAWSDARIVPLPFEIHPGNNIPASEITECRITFDAAHLYFGCTARDTDPESVRSYLTDRDEVDEQDRIGILLDPFRDSRRAFAFVVTASGIQADRIVGSGTDGDAWDAIWDASGARTADGYVVEAAIPFRSLRFPDDGGLQTWNFLMWRNHPRGVDRSFRSVPIDRNDLCDLCQLGSLTGLTGVRPGLNMEMTPVITAQRVDRRPAPDAPSLTTGDVEPEIGLDLRWSLTPSLTLNATGNPDFNQVEADAAQLQSNQQFALFFPERRPFFLEGAELFQTPLRTVFTRTLADPTYGGKLSGKRGGWAVGGLVGRDARTNYLFPGALASRAGTSDAEATMVVGRICRDLGRDHTLGALVTSREGTGYHNRLTSVDGRVHLTGPLNLSAQLARSETDYPDEIAEAFDQRQDSFFGTAGFARFDLSSRHWFGWLQGDFFEPGFRADAGFITGVDRWNVDGRIQRIWWPEGSPVNRVSFMGGGGFRNDWSGNPLYRFIFSDISVNGGFQSRFSVNPDYFHRFLDGQRFEIARLNLFGEIQPIGDAELGWFAQIGEELDFDNGREAGLLRVNPRLDLRAGRHIDLQLAFDFKRLIHRGQAVSTERLFRIRSVYYFTHKMFFRGIAQFRDLERDPSLHRNVVTPRSKSLNTQLLLAYKLNPVSVAFLGYSDASIDQEDTALPPNGLRRMSRVLFLKLSYTWRP